MNSSAPVYFQTPMPRFAANLSMMFTEVPFPQRFQAAARAGFNAVEFLFPYDFAAEDVAGWLSDNNLQNVLFNLPPGDWSAGERGCASIPGREAEFLASVDRALEYADRLGTPNLHAMAGIFPAGADRHRHRETYVKNLRAAAQQVAKHGRTLLIEAINPRDIPGFFLNTQAEAHAIREEVGETSLKIQMDFYHAQIVEGDLSTTFKKYLDAIAHVQIAGVPGRNEPDRGEVNYAYLFNLMDEIGYAGWVGCEYRPAARTEDGLGWLNTWRQGRHSE
jgi:2-dehydrotetronate isomerase